MAKIPSKVAQKLVDRFQKRFKVQDWDIMWHTDRGDSSPCGHVRIMTTRDEVDMGLHLAPVSFPEFRRTVIHEMLHVMQGQVSRITDALEHSGLMSESAYETWSSCYGAQNEAFIEKLATVLARLDIWDDSDLAERVRDA